ncbi:MAG TPA: hypothetical protein VGD65_05975 [Chryseosolibacter sp.]
MKRNYVWSLAGMLLWASTCLAQTELAPKEEYRVMASTNSITLAKGQQDSVKISIIRSKSFKSGKASLSTNPPSDSGVTMSMKQYPERPDEFIVFFSASPDAKAGEYSFVPTCSLRNKNKGIVLKLVIQ